MTKEKVNELALELIADNLDWALDDEKAPRDFVQFVDGIYRMRRRIVHELEEEKAVTE